MMDAKFERELDGYVEQLINKHHIKEKNGNEEDLKKMVKEQVLQEIDVEILSRLPEEKMEQIEKDLKEDKLDKNELKELIEAEKIDYDDVVKTVTERFDAVFSEIVKKKGAENE